MKLDIGNCEFWEKGCTNFYLKDNKQRRYHQLKIQQNNA